MRDTRGITLVALVVTIIILLILAGVSLNLVAGSEGILSKAENATEKYYTATLQEEIELAMVTLKTNYYEGKYVENNSSVTGTFSDYAKEHLKTGIPTSNGRLESTDGENVTYIDSKGNVIATGTFDNSTQTITILGITTPGITTKKSLVSQVTAENYGDKVNYSVTINDVELSDWKIFCNDGKVVTMILGDYLPNSTGLVSEAGLQSVSYYGVYSSINRIDLIDRLKDTSKWKGLLTKELETKGATAKGAVDLETWIASWNAKGYTKLYTAIKSMEDGLEGYCVGTEINPVSNKIRLSNDSGYDDKLYFTSKTSDKGHYDWLASPSAGSVNYVMHIYYPGEVGYGSYSNKDRVHGGIRPIICLPASIFGEKVEGIWNIE